MIELISTLLFLQINLYRLQNNFPIITHTQTACELAASRLVEIQTDFSHKQFSQQLQKFYKGQSVFGGENLGEYASNNIYNNSQNVLSLWKNSLKHNNVLLGNFDDGCVQTDGNYYVFEAVKKY